MRLLRVFFSLKYTKKNISEVQNTNIPSMLWAGLTTP